MRAEDLEPTADPLIRKNKRRMRYTERSCPGCGELSWMRKNQGFCSISCMARNRNRDYQSKANSPWWTGDDVTYEGMHQRIRQERGAPGSCEHCKTNNPDTLYEWAYDNQDPDEVTDEAKRRYSRDPARYVRLCVPCHRGWMDFETIARGENQHNAKLTADIVLDSKIRHAAGESYAALAREYGVDASVMSNAIRGKTWKHLGNVEAFAHILELMEGRE